MATRVPCTPFGKKMGIAIVGQGIPQQELARRSDIVSSTVSDITYGRDQCERTKERIVEALGIEGQETKNKERFFRVPITNDITGTLLFIKI